jgi:glycosyltransferase involved in cell wall biosynthesis
LSFFRKAKQTLERGNFDFIFADCEKAGFYAYLLSKQFGIPYVYSSHNVEFQRYLSMGRTNTLRYLLVPYIYVVESLACRRASLTVSISDSDAAVLDRWVRSDRIKVLPCAFDEDILNPFYEEIETERPVILMVANFRYGANQEAARRVVRQVVPEVAREYPECLFRFVGAGFPPDLRNDHIEVAGFVDDLKAEYQRAALVIAPIEFGGGVKIKVIEALATGKYLLTTEKGMEGIDYSDLCNVKVAQSADFGRHICEIIQQRPPKTDANWNLVSDKFGTRKSLNFLLVMIDQALDSGLMD